MFNFKKYRPTINQLGGLFFILVTFFSATSLANTESQRQIASELLQQLNIPAQLRSMANQTIVPLKIRLSRIKTTPEKAEIVREHIRQLETLIYDTYSWQNNKEHYIDIYVNAYSEDELKALSDFFSSPLGQKFLSPNQEFKDAMSAWNKDLAENLKPGMTQIQKELQEALAELTPSEESAQ